MIQDWLIYFMKTIGNIQKTFKQCLCKDCILKEIWDFIFIEHKYRCRIKVFQPFRLIEVIINSVKVKLLTSFSCYFFINMLKFVTAVAMLWEMEYYFWFLFIFIQNLWVLLASYSCWVICFDFWFLLLFGFESWFDFMIKNVLYPILKLRSWNLFFTKLPSMTFKEEFMLLLIRISAVWGVDINNWIEIIFLKDYLYWFCILLSWAKCQELGHGRKLRIILWFS